MGVEVAPGELSRAQPAVSNDKLIFEWKLDGADGSSLEGRVAVRCKHATTRGVPLPEFARGISAMQLEELGRRAALAGAARLRKKLGVNDLEVGCKYLGVNTTSGPPSSNAQVAHNVTVRYDNAAQRKGPSSKTC